MNANKIKSQIGKLANVFNLNFNTEWFAHIWVSNREEILIEFIGMCPDPIYQKYGRSQEKRISNIEKFTKSFYFKNCLKRYGGQVYHKSELKKDLKLVSIIKDKELKKEINNILLRIKSSFKKNDSVALLTKPRNKEEKDWQLKYCLRHEWIHILLDKNKIQFQEIAKKYWPYDEGINEYMAAYLDENLSKLEKLRDKEKYQMEKKYWVYAIKFRELLKDKKSSEERKKALRDLIKKLKNCF